MVSSPAQNVGSRVVWRTITGVTRVTPVENEWPTWNPPPTFAACGIRRHEVLHISLNNVLQVLKYLYTIWIVLCDQNSPNALPKWASKLGTYRTFWEFTFTTTFADTKCIIYIYLWFVWNNFVVWSIFLKILSKNCDFTILGNSEEKNNWYTSF